MTHSQPDLITDSGVVALRHPFVKAPHKTMLRLSLPVLLSLVAEPLTGLVDTGFIARLGTVPLAALGVGTMALSSIFWAFNFLGIGTQTEVAQALGREHHDRAHRMTTLAVLLALALGLLLIAAVWPLASRLAVLMGAADEVHTLSVDYIRVRLFGAPAVLVTIAAFGVFRGRQDMRTPLWITVTVNLLNVILDPLLIFGYGLLPRLGVAGAAAASVISQWTGAGILMILLYRDIDFTLGRRGGIRLAEAGRLLRIGQDLFIRTGMITLFLLLATRAATRLGPTEGAAHQAIRQIWVFTALFLDAYAVTGQSLAAFFAGARQLDLARRVARLVCLWSLFTGLVLALLMLWGRGIVILLFVPETAVSVFIQAWWIALIAQPINALAFATDGIHWGMGDFRFLRNVVLIATTVSASLLFLMGGLDGFSLNWIWAITGLWTSIRAGAGLLRIWPGTAGSPMNQGNRM